MTFSEAQSQFRLASLLYYTSDSCRSRRKLNPGGRSYQHETLHKPYILCSFYVVFSIAAHFTFPLFARSALEAASLFNAVLLCSFLLISAN